jgi:Bacterial Ig-like domain (group 2)
MANYGKNYPYGKSYYKDYSVVLTSILISPQSVSLNNGQQQQFSAQAFDQSGNDISNTQTFVWSSTGGTITQAGLYTVQASGTGTFGVTVHAGALSASSVVYVSASPNNNCNDGSRLAMTRVYDIIKRAMRLLQVISAAETPKAEEFTDFLQVLNWMIDEWTNQKLITYQIINETFATVGGKGTYTIGPDSSCDFNTMNPVKITGAYLRDTTPGYNNDWTLEIIPNDRYQQIFQKSINTTYPRFLHYVRSWPYGSIDLWPIPVKAYQLEISQWKQLTKFTSVQDVVCLPPGYKDALCLNLAVKMAPEFGKMVPDIADLAIKSLIPIKEINWEPVYLDIDSSLKGRTAYNIYGDIFRG